MNYIVMISSIVLDGLWGFYMFLRGKQGKRVAFFFALLATAAGSCLFQLYDYIIFKCMRYLILMNGVMLIAEIDHEKRMIPNKILGKLFLIRLIILVCEMIENRNSGYLKEVILVPVLGFLLGGGIFFLCYFLARSGIGAGDVKLFAVIGFYVGTGSIFPVMILSALFSAVYGIGMVALHKIKLKDRIPFGPFAAAGTVLALLAGF